MIERKIETVEDAAALRDVMDKAGMRLVFTNGCFDILHAGHVRYLQAARDLGDALIVGLNGDASVRSLKGTGRPINPAADRAEVLLALECVDGVVEFEDDRCTGLIELIRPHVYAKGGDYTPDSLNPEEKSALDAVDCEIVILPLVPGRSTSGTLRRLRANGESTPVPEGRTRLAVLGSGKGSNFDAICAAIDRGTLDAEVALVLSDREDARILRRARERGIDAVFVDPGPDPHLLPDAAQKEIRDRLVAAHVDLVVLAGFMRILKPVVLDAFPERILNIHPSLLPKFKGLFAWRQALEAGESETGCTVHLVNDKVDGGTILAQVRVPVEPGDTPESLHARIQEAEHVVFPRIIGEYARRVRLGAGSSVDNSAG